MAQTPEKPAGARRGRGIPLRITSGSVLSSFDIDATRFPKIDGGWAWPGFESANNRVTLDLHVGAASVSVH